MKSREELDRKMIDWLEGDLSDHEIQELEQLILEDDEMMEDWEAFQLTKLEPSRVEYKHKDALKKKDTRIIGLYGITWKQTLRVAAILLLMTPIAYFILRQQGPAPAGMVIAPVVNDSTEEVVEKTVVDETPQEVPVDQEAQPEPQMLVKEEVEQVVTPNKALETPVQVEGPKTRPLEVPELVYSEGVFIDYDLVEALNVPSPVTLIEPHRITVEQKEKFEYKGLRPTLNAGLAALVAPFRNSSLTVQPNRDKAGIEILYTSNKYEATAFLSLKPLASN